LLSSYRPNTMNPASRDMKIMQGFRHCLPRFASYEPHIVTILSVRTRDSVLLTSYREQQARVAGQHSLKFRETHVYYIGPPRSVEKHTWSNRRRQNVILEGLQRLEPLKMHFRCKSETSIWSS